jgi:hypothetical protein
MNQTPAENIDSKEEGKKAKKKSKTENESIQDKFPAPRGDRRKEWRNFRH